MKNAIDQARRETQQRYDLKDTKTTIDLSPTELMINTASETSLDAVKDLIESKLVRRSISLKVLDYGEVEQASGGRVRLKVKLRQGISEDLAKQLNKRIRDDFKKVTPQIQGDTLRVQAKNKDDLQAVIQALKQTDYPVALQFINFR
jgi:uncharacterized protein YajQ (UPF0234 family)